MQEVKTEKLIIVGKTGSGKDFLIKGLRENNLPNFPKLTTRPQRAGEEDGKDYKFTDNTKFEQMLSDGQMKTHQSFEINGQTWYYGVSLEDYQNGQLFVMTPHEISQLTKEDLVNCFVVYLDIDEDIRKQRLLERNDQNDSIDRRLQADDQDFKDYDYYDLKITDPEFESDWVYSLMN